MDLLSFVEKPTWREFLVDLVQSNQMDPWDINLVEVADKYLQKVRELQSVDLRLPANVILASALLLRFKADALKLEEDDELEDAVEEFTPLTDEEIPSLVFRANLPRQRKLTLQELLVAVDQVMKQGPRKIPLKVAAQPLNVELPQQSIHERIAEVYAKAFSVKDAENVLLFSALLKEKTAEEFVFNLLPILHLVQENRLLAWQDELFGEIFIKIVDVGGGRLVPSGASV
ncbi:MAG: segregation/condensation protein A [Candidatus Micrarchaeia archaeon]